MTTKNQFRKKAQHKIDKLQAKIDILKQQMDDCNRDADETAIEEFRKKLHGALLEHDGTYFAKVDVVRDGNTIALNSKWLCMGAADLPSVTKWNPFVNRYDRNWFLTCLYDGKFKIHSDPEQIREIINRGIAEYEDAFDTIMLAINGVNEHNIAAPDLSSVTAKTVYQTLLRLNGSLYIRKYDKDNQYIWFRVVEIGDGTLLVKWYMLDFCLHSDSATCLPIFYEGKIFPCVRVYPYEKKTMSVVKEIRKVIKNEYTEFKPAESWDELLDRMESIRKHTNDGRAYAKNDLIDYILDPTPDPTAEA